MSWRVTLSNGNTDEFVWGPIAKVHSIGPYDLVEFQWKKSFNRAGETAYAIYIDGKDCGINADSIDRALACAIAYRNDGCGSRAGYYFLRMIGADK